MPTPAQPLDLASFLAIDLAREAKEYQQRRRQGVRDRFLAGVLDALRTHGQPEVLWMDLAERSSIHWIRAAATIDDHRARLASKDPSTRTERAFFKALGTTRAAISSSSVDTEQNMKWLFPGWCQGPMELRRPALEAILVHLLENPEERLTSELAHALVAQHLDQTLPSAGKCAPGPRL